MTQSAPAMAGRTCLVTGATSGIGKATATGLARLGADVVLVARDPAKGRATVAEIQAATGNPRVEVLLADLSSQALLRQAAEEYRRTHDRLHVLVNNAGVSLNHRSVTADGRSWRGWAPPRRGLSATEAARRLEQVGPTARSGAAASRCWSRGASRCSRCGRRDADASPQLGDTLAGQSDRSHQQVWRRQ